ncbi:hypothetical protein BKH41_03835 [Helicobacter sp. 12S02232-10]|uniref:phage major capsid protein n=1 Tax=Helicobacter sp. 12S02232-10 TaxID=1476197 RepID=UPI000BDCEF59|nr:phage major capsid protein [Helicobacter sp. 12S02232-10]PAF49221.1 hypothetical protein BKH41_03835 [Helicobacter sp. 12S02232-10]
MTKTIIQENIEKTKQLQNIKTNFDFSAQLFKENPIDEENLTISFIALSNHPTIKRSGFFEDYYVSINTDRVVWSAKHLFLDHNPTFNNSIGRIDEVKKDGEGFKVKVKFFEDIPASKEAFDRFKTGLNDSVSVGFGDSEVEEVGEIDGIPHYQIKSGEIVELSAVWKGADPQAVVSKFSQISNKERVKEVSEAKTITHSNLTSGENQMTTDIQNQTQETLNISKEQKLSQELLKSIPTHPNEESNYAKEAKEIAQLAEILGVQQLGLQAVSKGQKFAEFREEVYQSKLNNQLNFSIKTSDKAQEPAFSIANIVKGTAGVELDYKTENGRFKLPNSFFNQFADPTPYDVAGTDTIKSNLPGVKSIEPITYHGDKFIELIRQQSKVLSMLDIMTDLTGVQQIPRDETSFNAYFLEEGQSIQGQTPTFSDIKLEPHTIYVKIKLTRQMLYMTPFALNSYIIKKIIQAVKFKAEEALFYGTSPITGIFNLAGTSAINDFLAKPSYKGALDFKAKLWSNDYDTSKCVFICNSTDYVALEGTPKSINENNITETERTLLENGKMVGFDVVMNNIFKDKDIMLADLSNVLMGIWSKGLEIKYLETEGGISTIEAFYDIDYGFKRPNAFVTSTKAKS